MGLGICISQMRRSVIDIGTNTMLLLIAESDESTDGVKTILDIQRVPRLGKGVDAARNILPSSITIAAGIINEYKAISAEHKSEQITATATSFIRDSGNKSEFISSIKNATGIEIEILSGQDEAKYTFLGGVFDKISGKADGNMTVIDIGGGSTEITLGSFTKEKSSADIIGSKSLNVGSVRLNEKFLNQHPPESGSISSTEFFIDDLLNQSFKPDEFDKSGKSLSLIGVAGTVTTLAAIKHNLPAFDAAVVDGTVLSLNEIDRIFSDLTSMQLKKIYSLGNYMEGRADIIIPGILILKTFMRKFGFESVTVSTKGLRYGIFLRDTSISFTQQN
jgi:exopolyphosphatase/guanosine-5'-triphosphate,3'-diphosphate pyrophosphatase